MRSDDALTKEERTEIYSLDHDYDLAAEGYGSLDGTGKRLEEFLAPYLPLAFPCADRQ